MMLGSQYGAQRFIMSINVLTKIVERQCVHVVFLGTLFTATYCVTCNLLVTSTGCNPASLPVTAGIDSSIPWGLGGGIYKEWMDGCTRSLNMEENICFYFQILSLPLSHFHKSDAGCIIPTEVH